MLVIIMAIVVLIIIKTQVLSISKFLEKVDFRKIKIDEQKRCVFIQDSVYHFSDIERVSVVEDSDQPTLYEQYMSRGCYNAYFATMMFKLKDGTRVSYHAVSKMQIYKIFKKLQPYVKVPYNWESYKGSFFSLGAVLVFVIILFLIIFFFSGAISFA
ncbi:MAG: hypothetical protein SOT02_05275 [Elusimicrobiaceae bacterium]|uniref:hypothetical protein n=1 Tax=Candidatus Avelusimicrobium faecicola TaxID=3416205 RepID=UPI002A77AE92|nr:hypothetical protein [Spirochaetota bacterium]MDY2940349.1 hypothetical protein [Elusimicrobiaceae bacterium]